MKRAIILTPRQGRTLWWLLAGTKDSTTDRGMALICGQIMEKLEKAGVEKEQP